MNRHRRFAGEDPASERVFRQHASEARRLSLTDGKEKEGGQCHDPARPWKTLYPLVRKELSFLLGFHPWVEEAVQEAMIEILRSLPSFEGRSSIRTWALRIATRTGWRQLRRARLERSVHDVPEGVFDGDAETRAEAALLARALSALSPKLRGAFILVEILDLTAEDAGFALGVPANTAASRCRLARQSLRATFA